MAWLGLRASSLEGTISRISDNVSALSELMGETASEEAKASIRGLRQRLDYLAEESDGLVAQSFRRAATLSRKIRCLVSALPLVLASFSARSVTDRAHRHSQRKSTVWYRKGSEAAYIVVSEPRIGCNADPQCFRLPRLRPRSDPSVGAGSFVLGGGMHHLEPNNHC
jgi:hypothetical protein